jgi:hypothetical protein
VTDPDRRAMAIRPVIFEEDEGAEDLAEVLA